MYCNYIVHFNSIEQVWEDPSEDYNSKNAEMEDLVKAVWAHEEKEHREAVCPYNY